MHRSSGRMVLIAFVGGVSAACALAPPAYESAPDGPRARLNFASPYLEDRFMAIDGLGLSIFEADRNCTLIARGNLSLSPNAKVASAHVPANRRAYFSVWQRSSGMLGSRDARLGFSFVPVDGAEYTVEHIDNPSRLRVEYFRHGPDGRKVPFEVKGLDACEVSARPPA